MYAGTSAERAEGAAKMEVLYTDSDEESNDVVVTGMEDESMSAEEFDVEEAAEEAVEEAAAGAKKKRRYEAAIWASGTAFLFTSSSYLVFTFSSIKQLSYARFQPSFLYFLT